MSDIPFTRWGEIDFSSITDQQYSLVIESILNEFGDYSDDTRFKEAPPTEDTPKTFNDYAYIIFKNNRAEVWGLYHKRDQYLFAVKPVKSAGRVSPRPFERVGGIQFPLSYQDMVEVPDLNVTYGSLQALTTPSYSLPDMSNAVTVLSQGFSNNNLWGPAFATLIGVTSDAIKSIGMKRHVCFGLNVKSKIAHFPSNRLLRINKCWDKISKSIRSLRFDYVLKYKDEKGRDVEEAVTKFSAGLIFAIINSKDGSKEEKLKNKQKKDQFKRKRDANEEREYGGRREAGRGTGFKQQKGNQAPQNRGGKYQRSASGSAPGDTAAEEEHPSFLCNSMTSEEEKEEWNILADKIPEPNEEYPNAFIRVDKEPPFDYSDEEDRPFVVRVVPRNCDPSDSSSSYFSKSDSDETIGEEESGINKESSPKDWEKQLEFLPEDQTSTEPIEERLDLVFDLDSRIEAIQLAKSSTTELVSGPTVPSSSILVKHGGTKRPAESAVGDEDFKRANKMLMSKSTDDQNNKTETELDVQVNKKIS